MTYLILTTSKGWLTVTAPQAAMPPAINVLKEDKNHEYSHQLATYPAVVAMASNVQREEAAFS